MRVVVVLSVLLLLLACEPIEPKHITGSFVEKKNNSQDIVIEEESLSNETIMVDPEIEEGLPTKVFMEGDFVSFPNLRATDPDGDPIYYTFTDPLNEKGEWQTKEGDAGEYRVTISASDGRDKVSQEVIIVVRTKNQPPIIDIDDRITILAGDSFVLEPRVTDADGNNLTIMYRGWTSTNKISTNSKDVGEHVVQIIADDGRTRTTKSIVIEVLKQNRAPVIKTVGDVKVKEGEKIRVEPKVEDPDGDEITLNFSEPLDSKGEWQTKRSDVGVYNITIFASDGQLTTKQTFRLTVGPINQAPIVEVDGSYSVNEGDTVVLEPKITDPEGDEVTVVYSGWMTSSQKETAYGDQGSHDVTITVKDSAGNIVERNIVINVANINRPPTFNQGSFD